MSERERLCVYTHSANGQIFYVGYGAPLRPYTRATRNSRWRDHVKRAGEYEIAIRAWTYDRAEAQRIESEMISAHNPFCNILKSDNRIFAIEKYVRVGLSLKIKPSLKAAIVKAAQEDGRTVAQIAERILEAAMREGGYLK
jgi:hypothetical protein